VTFSEFSSVLQIVIWPVVALIAIAVVRPYLAALLAGAKVKLSMGGQSIETTLPELREVIEEQAGGILTPEHIAYLEALFAHGVKSYPKGIEGEEQKLLRPVRNSGLIMTIPKDASLGSAHSIQLSALGRLYLRARQIKK